MTDRPIIFTGEMVLALLAGRKTTTRRIMAMADGAKPPTGARFCVGDRLWVREGFALMPKTAYALPKTISPDPDMAAYYRSDFDRSGKPGWKPSIHMPRWASRITLDVTDVKVERLHDISEDDAIYEGIELQFYTGSDPQYFGSSGYKDYRLLKDGTPHPHAVVPFRSPIRSYQSLWERINGEGSWEANPFVVAPVFTVRKENIDARRA